MSPSTIIQSYLKADDELPLDDFLLKAEKAFVRRTIEREGRC